MLQATAATRTGNEGARSAPPSTPETGAHPLDRLMAGGSPLDRLAPPPSYTVRHGDTLSSIATALGTDWQTLARINGISNPDRIATGQTLRLPGGATAAAATHTVQRGETLSGIAAQSGTDVATLARINAIDNPNRIQPGQVLRLGGSGAAPVAHPPRSAPAANAGDTQAGTGGPVRLGSVSERYESGGRGPGTVSNGSGDPGGVSYGVYQLSSKAGTLQSFLRHEGARWSAELGSNIGTKSFNDQWKAIAARDPQGFRDAQHAFIERTHYDPAVNKVRDATGLDLSTRHVAVQQAAWSSAVQHARAPQLLEAAVRRTDQEVGRASPDYDRALVSNIYAERTTYLQGLAASGNYSPAEASQLRSITQERYPNERREALALFDRPASATTGGTAPIAGKAAGEPRTGADFAAVINRSGDAQARADLAAGRKVLVAVRHDSSLQANGGRGEYNDTIALVSRQADGSYRAQVFQGNTEPAGVYAARGYGADVNGDGRKELGRLVEGNYRYELQSGTFAGNRFFRATETQTALRDSNHDGRFTGADTLDRRGAGRSMLIHQGGNSSTGSAGCQTLRPSDFNALLAGLGRQSSFSYVLVNASQ
ncbi:LysM domain-containing protein [uncultured Sphingomonas sp.]|uniref:LysM peptidoglycan-binding domain-containing protein n=1 Tax=uncultured Sphingomonas sp. TaxID=158754 RepID=UPI0025D6DD51|nr:LysM domain-containing protein [uncultured Sphingomonas sp.]